MVKKIKKFFLKRKKLWLCLALLLTLGLGFLLAFLIFRPQTDLSGKATPVETPKTVLPEDKSRKLESRWVHPADSAYKGIIELWNDGNFTFKGFNAPDFISGGQWKFDRNVLILTFTQDTDYWRGMFKASEDFVDYYDEVLEMSLGTTPSITMDVYKCSQIMDKACFNFFNWYFYEESDLNTAESKAETEPKQEKVSEEAGIWEAVYDYAPQIDMMSPSVDFKLDKIVGNYALVQVIPQGNAEGAALILEKVGGEWVVQDFGTYFPEWEEKAPALFQW